MHIPLQISLMLTSDVWPPFPLGKKNAVSEKAHVGQCRSLCCVWYWSPWGLSLSYSRTCQLKAWAENIYIWSAHSDFWSIWTDCHHCRCSQSVLKRFSASLTVAGVLLALNYDLTPVSTFMIEFQPLSGYAICHRAPWNMGRDWDNWVCSVWRRKFYRGLNCFPHCQMREQGAKTPPCCGEQGMEVRMRVMDFVGNK